MGCYNQGVVKWMKKNFVYILKAKLAVPNNCLDVKFDVEGRV